MDAPCIAFATSPIASMEGLLDVPVLLRWLLLWLALGIVGWPLAWRLAGGDRPGSIVPVFLARPLAFAVFGLVDYLVRHFTAHMSDRLDLLLPQIADWAAELVYFFAPNVRPPTSFTAWWLTAPSQTDAGGLVGAMATLASWLQGSFWNTQQWPWTLLIFLLAISVLWWPILPKRLRALAVAFAAFIGLPMLYALFRLSLSLDLDGGFAKLGLSVTLLSLGLLLLVVMAMALVRAVMPAAALTYDTPTRFILPSRGRLLKTTAIWESVGVVCFIAVAVFVGMANEPDSDFEGPNDLATLTTVGESFSYPPDDRLLAGVPLNYHYAAYIPYGRLGGAVEHWLSVDWQWPEGAKPLTPVRATDLSPYPATYSFALTTAFTLLLLVAAGLAFAISGHWWIAALALLMVGFAGNLGGIVQLSSEIPGYYWLMVFAAMATVVIVGIVLSLTRRTWAGLVAVLAICAVLIGSAILVPSMPETIGRANNQMGNALGAQKLNIWHTSRVMLDHVKTVGGRPVDDPGELPPPKQWANADIAKPITEYPTFSLWIGDLHAHVLNLPMVLALAAAMVCLIRLKPWPGWMPLIAIGSLAGFAIVSHPLDGPIIVLVVIATLLARVLAASRSWRWSRMVHVSPPSWLCGIVIAVFALSPLAIYMTADFDSPIGGVWMDRSIPLRHFTPDSADRAAFERFQNAQRWLDSRGRPPLPPEEQKAIAELEAALARLPGEDGLRPTSDWSVRRAQYLAALGAARRAINDAIADTDRADDPMSLEGLGDIVGLPQHREALLTIRAAMAQFPQQVPMTQPEDMDTRAYRQPQLDIASARRSVNLHESVEEPVQELLHTLSAMLQGEGGDDNREWSRLQQEVNRSLGIIRRLAPQDADEAHNLHPLRLRTFKALNEAWTWDTAGLDAETREDIRQRGSWSAQAAPMVFWELIRDARREFDPGVVDRLMLGMTPAIEWVEFPQSRPRGFLLVLGLPLAFLAFAIWRVLVGMPNRGNTLGWLFLGIVAVLLAMSVLTFLEQSLIPLGLLVTLAIFATIAAFRTSGDRRQSAALLIGVAGLVLLALPEFVALQDIYGLSMIRHNTTFKAYYAAQTLLLVAGVALLAWRPPLERDVADHEREYAAQFGSPPVLHGVARSEPTAIAMTTGGPMSIAEDATLEPDEVRRHASHPPPRFDWLLGVPLILLVFLAVLPTLGIVWQTFMQSRTDYWMKEPSPRKPWKWTKTTAAVLDFSQLDGTRHFRYRWPLGVTSFVTETDEDGNVLERRSLPLTSSEVVDGKWAGQANRNDHFGDPIIAAYLYREKQRLEREGVSGSDLPRVMEFPDGAYNDQSARAAIYSGMPSLLGWKGHHGKRRPRPASGEAVWDSRSRRIRQAYTNPTSLAARQFLHELDVGYVVISGIERSKYGNIAPRWEQAAGEPWLSRVDLAAELGIDASTVPDDAAVYRVDRSAIPLNDPPATRPAPPPPEPQGPPPATTTAPLEGDAS